MDKGISHVLSMSILLYGLQRPIFNSQDKEPYSFVGLKAQEKTGLLLMPTAKVTKNVSAAEGGGNVLCSILISIKTKAWLYFFRFLSFGIASRFYRCNARSSARLHTTALLANYASLGKEEFARSALQAGESSAMFDFRIG